MTAELLAQSFASTRGVLANVTPAQFEGDVTPCASWSVKELVDHIVNGTNYFAGTAETGTPPADDALPAVTPGGFLEDFDAGSARAVRAFGADGAMERIMHLPFGELPGSVYVNIACGDTFTHGWDLARATGQSTDLDPVVAAQILEFAKPFLPDALRGPDGQAPFGPEQKAPAGACAADQLAAFMGRQL
ncbi:MAG TPA: TIGR03086 family metal-binding protein [Acidimicrobiales bacterium]|jgi:uncharacterized protein (TIGR03086 family)|nr:TIGR03086 family metal-binding protein [Acidimicrobiales bacterium]